MIYFVVYFGIGILANLIGPLAKHLSIEGKHALTENKNKSWFYKYSFVLALRVFMTIIYPIFYFSSLLSESFSKIEKKLLYPFVYMLNFV